MTTFSGPNRFKLTPSQERLREMTPVVERHGGTVPKDFDIDETHWVLPRLGITDYEGCDEAVLKGHFVINVAGEIQSAADIQSDINPGTNTVQKTLNKLAKIIDEKLKEDETTKVVVHCAMGMERSPLTVVWYLHKYHQISIDDAYEKVRAIRPIVLDRRDWIQY